MFIAQRKSDIIEVTIKQQIIFPFSEIITQNNGNKSSFERKNRNIWRLVVTATMSCIPAGDF